MGLQAPSRCLHQHIVRFVSLKLRLLLLIRFLFSGHKFGLSYVGVGWIVWRDKAHLPKDLIFELHYLGSVEYSFSLNFSRPAAPIIAQYFNFLHLGFEGYRSVGLAGMKTARLLSRALERTGHFTVLSDIHRAVGAQKQESIDSSDIEVSYWLRSEKIKY
jgi:glutamate decarboxylase